MHRLSTFMDTLPVELVECILANLPLCELKNKAMKVSSRWRFIARNIAKQRLETCAKILSDTESKSASIWLLGNFEEAPESSVVTAHELNLTSFNAETASLKFMPTNTASFGMWVDHLGYIPITAPYDCTHFAFPPMSNPKLSLWFHPPPNKPMLTTPRHAPASTNGLNNAMGNHKMVLRDEIGDVGVVAYTITETSKRERMDTSRMGEGVGDLMRFLDDEESKVNGKLTAVNINPQVLFTLPL